MIGVCGFTKSVCVSERGVNVANVFVLHAATCAELHNACSVAEHLLPPRVGGAIMIRSAPVKCDRNFPPVLHNIHVRPSTARDFKRTSEWQV